jgi:integrase
MARKDGKDRGLFQRPAGSGVWWIQWTDETGAKRRRKVGSKEVAQRAYTEAKADTIRAKRNSATAKQQPASPLLVATIIGDYLSESQATKRSHQDDARFAQTWVMYLGGRTVESIVPGDIETWRRLRLAKRPKPRPATLNRYVAFLKRVFNVAIRDGKTERNPVARVKLLKEENTRVRFLEDTEEALLRAQLEPLGLWHYVSLALNTGLRQSEQLSLRWEYIDLTNRVLRLPRSKSGAARAVELNDEALRVLSSLPSRGTSAWVYPNERQGENHLGFTKLRKPWEAALSRAGIHNFHWHDLRHTFASRLTMSGVPAQVIMELMGHSSLSMVLRYSHLSPSHRHEAVGRLVSRRMDTANGHRATDNSPDSTP